MNENKDYYDDYDNFDYQGYYSKLNETAIRGLSGELNHGLFYYDSHI